MKTGKISNTILDRSIVKVISKKPKSKLLNRPGAGHDCAAFVCGDSETADSSVRLCDMACVSSVGYGEDAVYTAVNNLAVEGVTATAVTVCIVMPESCREIALKRIMSRINDDCLKLGVEIAGGHTHVSKDVISPVIMVTAQGVCNKANRLTASLAKPEQDIIMSGVIGKGGVRKIIDLKREELVNYFNEATVDKAYGVRDELSIVDVTRLACKAGVSAMHDVSTGGIYAGLWDMMESAHLGLEVDFRKILVSQEIIEVCEYFDINPYELESTGCLLMTADDGCAIVEILENAGISAAVIGRTKAGNERIISNRDEVRYLEAPKQDEINSELRKAGCI